MIVLTTEMTREKLEEIAIMECWMTTAVVDAATDSELFELICQYVEDGDECAGAA